MCFHVVNSMTGSPARWEHPDMPRKIPPGSSLKHPSPGKILMTVPVLTVPFPTVSSPIFFFYYMFSQVVSETDAPETASRIHVAASRAHCPPAGPWAAPTSR